MSYSQLYLFYGPSEKLAQIGIDDDTGEFWFEVNDTERESEIRDWLNAVDNVEYIREANTSEDRVNSSNEIIPDEKIDHVLSDAHARGRIHFWEEIDSPVDF